MKIIIRLFFFLLTITIQINAQQTASTAWGKQYGFPQEKIRVAADNLGNCFIAGTSTDSLSVLYAGRRDAFLRKFDAQGNILWTINIGSDKDDYCYFICSDAVGNCYMAGKTMGTIGAANLGDLDAFICKISSSGNVLWRQQFGTDKTDDLAYITLDNNGNCVATGSTLGSFDRTTAGTTDAIFVKFSPDGNLIWKKQYGTSSSEAGKYICFDKNNTGYAILTSKGILQFPESGDISLKFTHPLYDASGLAIDDSLNIYFGGTTGVTNGSQAILIKYNKDLVKQWEKKFGAGSWTGINSMLKLKDGTDDILLGVCQAYPTCSAVVRRYDTQGSVKWIYTLKNNVNSVCGQLITADNSGNFYITGATDGNLFATKVKSQEFFLSKITLSGLTDVKSSLNKPINIELEQNYPNPFNPSTIISYQLQNANEVSLKIYDTLGQEIKTHINDFQAAGEYSVVWNGTDDSDNPVSSGVYFYSLVTSEVSIQKKMMLVR